MTKITLYNSEGKVIVVYEFSELITFSIETLYNYKTMFAGCVRVVFDYAI